MKADNLFEDLPDHPFPDEERIEVLVQSAAARIERIISCGQVTQPEEWYDQDEEEWVALLHGEAEITFGDGTILQLKKGDHLLIPAGCRHRVTYTSQNPPAVWLAVFFRNQNP
jgi:cupin 2 domain-containing protein